MGTYAHRRRLDATATPVAWTHATWLAAGLALGFLVPYVLADQTAAFAHAGMHVTAVVHSYDTDLFLPPHR